MDTTRVPLARQSRLRTIVAGIVATLTVTLLAFIPTPPAKAADVGPGYDLPGVEDTGLTMWLGALSNPNDPNWLQWCIEAGKPIPEAQAVSVTTLSESLDLGQGEFSVTTPQMAWLLENKEGIVTADSRAALSFLLHANYDVTGSAVVARMITQANIQLPQVVALARQYIAEAKASAAVGYENTTIEGEGKREGIITGIAVTNNDGSYITGTPMELTLRGPAVFKATGTNKWSGLSQSSPITLEWQATGNGEVTYLQRSKGSRKTLTRYGVDGSVQETLSYGSRPSSDPEWVDGPSRTFRVIYDFQPKGVSSVGEGKRAEHETTTLSDTLTAFADPNYGDGQWLVIDGTPVPVVFEGTAYYTGEHPAAQSATVPTGAKVVGSTTLRFDDPGTQTATVTTDVPVNSGFVTWVWKVVKNNQTGTIRSGSSEINLSELVHADWADAYGLADETSVVPFKGVIDTAASARVTKRGTYLVDDVWVSGLPTDHPNWAGSHGFDADVSTLTQTLLFFPEGLDVVEANKNRAEVIASVELPAKNGFYPSVGDNAFKVKEGVPGTYVFVTSFAGDGRVDAMTTSVEDKTEQFTVEGEIPEIGTTATDKADGDKILDNFGTVTIVDKVCASKGLVPGREYTVEGVLMDKDTGKPLQEDGKNITASTTFVAQTPTDCVDVEFTLNASTLAGKTTVVFEDLYTDGKRVATHADINDEGQTVTTPPSPSIGTTATDKADGDKTVEANSTVTITDKVCYDNLTPGKEYTLDGTLMNKSTGKPVEENGTPVTGTKTFTPDKATGCVDVEFTFSTHNLAGSQVVVFENLKRDGIEVAVHADINDEGQTVTISEPPTPPTPGKKNLAKTGADTTILLLAGLSCVAGVGAVYSARLGRFSKAPKH